MSPCLGVAEGSGHRPGHLVPGSGQCGEGLFDVRLARPALRCDQAIRLLEAVPQTRELTRHRFPWIVAASGRRIILVRLHLLDGTYELFRSHFGRKDTVLAPDGSDVKATLGILESTLALLRQPGVTHLAASFDTVIESFRNDMFDGYKSSAGMEQVLLAQFPLAEEALRSIGVVVWGNVEFEADDAIATAAVRWVEDVDQVVIATPDKDLAQVVIGDRIVTYNRREEKMIDEAGVVEKFGVHPESIPDYLALMGDTADGVPGLPGWGAKSASTVLSRYPRLELIPDNDDDWDVDVRSAAKLSATLRENRDLAYLYRELTTLRLDVPISESLSDLEWRGVPRSAFEGFCSRLGFDASRINVHRWSDQG
jgi:5'-3' exonuclease